MCPDTLHSFHLDQWLRQHLESDGDLMMAGNPFVALLKGHTRVVVGMCYFLEIRALFGDTDGEDGVRRIVLSRKMRQAGVRKAAGELLFKRLTNARGQSMKCFPVFNRALEVIMFEVVDGHLAATGADVEGVFTRVIEHFGEMVTVLTHLQFGVKYHHVDQNEACAANSLGYLLDSLRGQLIHLCPLMSCVFPLLLVSLARHRRRCASGSCS